MTLFTHPHSYHSNQNIFIMSEPIKNVTLKFPCREKWDQLEIVPGGRLCTSCAHVVRDFRDCSKEDLNSALQTQSHVCGIFNRSQLSSTFLKAASIAIAATTISACNTEQPTPVVETVTQSLNEIEFEEPTMGIVFTPLPDTLPIPLPDTLKGNEYSRE